MALVNYRAFFICKPVSGKEQLQAGVLLFLYAGNRNLETNVSSNQLLVVDRMVFTTFEYKSLFLLFHDQVPLIFEREIAIIITKEVGFAGPGSVNMCHILKMKSKPV